MNNLLSLEVTNRKNLVEYPFKSPLFQRGFRIDFAPVTILVGENGVGKSTLLESLAYHIGFPTYGGNANNNLYYNELNRVVKLNSHRNKVVNTLQEELIKRPDETVQIDDNVLSEYMKLSWRYRSQKGFFLRAETFAMMINLPRYSRSTNMSHGEGIVDVISNIRDNGVYILDEPEAGLSPSKTIELMANIINKASVCHSQFILSTHSPILMCLPEAKPLRMTEDSIEQTTPEETSHFQMTKYILNNKEKFFRSLRG